MRSLTTRPSGGSGLLPRVGAFMLMAAAVLPPVGSARHLGTVSYPTITIYDSRVEVTVRADALLFADVLDFGVPRGGSLSAEAILSRKAEISRVATEGIAVTLDGAQVPLLAESVDVLPSRTSGTPDVRVQLGAGTAPFRHLVLRYEFFRNHDPDHRGLARIVAGAATSNEVLKAARPFQWTRPAPGDAGQSGPSAFGWTLFLDGIDHILSGVDHLLFLFGLVIVAAGARQVVTTVTAFTISHSLALALAGLKIVHLPRGPIEVLIAVSVAWVGVQNLRARGSHRWPIALAFGLVHGLGFSEALAGLDLGAAAAAMALLLFNSGVEFGQVMLLLIALPPLFAWRERWPATYARWMVRPASWGVVAAGTWLAVARLIG